VEQGSGLWADASWPGIAADLKPPSTVAWNSPTDLSQMMMTSKKVSEWCVFFVHLLLDEFVITVMMFINGYGSGNYK